MMKSKKFTSSQVPYYVRALAMGLPAICFGLTLQPWLNLKRLVQGGGGDLRHLYTAAYMLRTGNGRALYSYAAQKTFQDLVVSPRPIPLPFNHPAYEALIFVPLSYLSYEFAFAAWFAINMALICACICALKFTFANLQVVWPGLPFVMFVGFIPLSVALMQGQDSILLLSLLCLSFITLCSGKDYVAGVILGLALFKFQLVVPIFLLFVLWRRWWFIFGTALTSIACFFCSLCIVGLDGARTYWNLLHGMSSNMDAQHEFLYSIPPSFMGNIRGLVYVLLQPLHLSSQAIHSAVLFVTFATLIAVAYFARKRPCVDQLLIAIAAASLTSYHFLSHDLSILLLPIIVLFSHHAQDESWLLILAVAFTAPALDMIYRPWMFLGAFAILALLIKLLQYSPVTIPSTSPQLAPAALKMRLPKLSMSALGKAQAMPRK
jgi:hypothetical protein